MTDEERAQRRKKFRKYAVLAGLALGLLCKALPPEYQSPCETLVSFCTGG